jgi:hypothetical protein
VNRAIVPLLATSLALAWSAPVLAQQGPDNLWEVTSAMTMEGMRVPGPPTQVCTKAGQTDGMTPPMQGECQFTDRNTVGNRTTFRVTCTGQDAMSGTGEITTTPTSYQGIMRLSGKVGGETASMTSEYSGRLVGKCTAK